ncbi:MAG: hypothetical protein FJZ56_02760 [Chlamydiae bacterium]|nr:hypothetical protein [Chlamydiota bacterium]
MIPFILIAAGGFLMGSSRSKMFGLGDIVEEKPIEVGDEVVFSFKSDTWVELFDDSQDLVAEEQFQEGGMFEVVVNEITDVFYLVTLPEGYSAAINKNDVDVVAINDEVASYRNGGKLKTFKAGGINQPYYNVGIYKPNYNYFLDFAEVSNHWEKTKNVKETVSKFKSVLAAQKKKNKYIGYFFTQRDYQKLFNIPEHDYNRTKKQIKLIQELRKVSEGNKIANKELLEEDFKDVIAEYKKSPKEESTAVMFVDVLKNKYPGIEFKMTSLYPIFKINPRAMTDEELAFTTNVRRLAKSVDKSNKAYIYKFKHGGLPS